MEGEKKRVRDIERSQDIKIVMRDINSKVGSERTANIIGLLLE